MWKQLLPILCWLPFVFPAYAQSSITPAPDSTNTQVQFTGNQYHITGGTSAGQNLFHSFQQLGLNPGEIANFIAQPHIQNILGRVVGGEASLINGLIQVVGSNANLFLMNPAGIIFGPNAQLNVPADFTATTATAIAFGNHQWFNAQGNNNYSQLISTPTEFYFPDSQPGVILNEGQLTINPQQQLTLLGGTVINLGTLEAPGGKITVAAIPGEQVVRISQAGHLLTIDLPLSPTPQTPKTPIQPPSLAELITGGSISHAHQIRVNQQGQIELTGSNLTLPKNQGLNITSGNLNVSGNQGGEIQLLGENIGLIHANVNASGHNGGGTIFIGGDVQGKGVLPNASRTFISEDSTVSADGLTTGDGGKIIVFAEETSRIYGNLSATGGENSGNGGFIETSGLQYFEITKTPHLSAPFGQGGQWLIDPYNIEIIAGNGNTNINNTNPFAPTADSAQLGVNLITQALNNSSSVQISTGTGGTQLGNITLSTNLDFDGTGNSSLTLDAAGGIFINGQIFDSNTTTPDSLNLIFQAMFQAQGEGINVSQNISTRGGNIQMTGTSTGIGILIDAPLNSGGGQITLSGNSLGPSDGISIQDPITSEGGGINFNGTSNGGRGIYLSGTLNSGGGDISLNTITNGGLISLYFLGEVQSGSGDIRMNTKSPYITQAIGGTGDLLIQGQSPNIEIGADNFGYITFLNREEINLFQNGFNSITIESTNGDLTVLERVGAQTTTAIFKDPIFLKATGNISIAGLLAANTNPLDIEAGGAFILNRNQFLQGDLTITAADVNLDCCLINSTSGNNITFKQIKPNASMMLGKDEPGVFSFNNTELANHIQTTGTVTIENTGKVTVQTLLEPFDLSNKNGTNGFAERQYTFVVKGQTINFVNSLTLGSNQVGQFIATGDLLNPTMNSAIINGQVLLDAQTIGTVTNPFQIQGNNNSVLAAISRSGGTFLDFDVFPNTLGTVAGVSGVQSAGQLILQGTATLGVDGDLTSNGMLQIQNPLNLVNGVSLNSNGGLVELQNTVNGAENLAVNANVGNVIFKEKIGNITPLEAVTVNSSGTTEFEDEVKAGELTTDAEGTTEIGANITTEQSQIYQDAVVLQNSVVLESNNGEIGFESTVNGTQDLTLNLGTGNLLFSEAVGNLNALVNLNINSGGLTRFGSTVDAAQVTTDAGGITELNGEVNTTGSQTYGDGVVLGNSVTLRATNSDIAFGGTVEGSASGEQNLRVETGTGTIGFGGAVGGTTPLGSLTLVGDEINFNAVVAGTGLLTVEPFRDSQRIQVGGTDNNDLQTLALTATEIGFWQNGFEGIVVGRNSLSGELLTEGSLGFADPVVLKTGGVQTISGAISGEDDASIALEAAQVILKGDITTNNNPIAIASPLTLGADVTLSTGSGDGNLTLSGTIDGNFALTLDSGTGHIALNHIGQTTPLNRLEIRGQILKEGAPLSITTLNNLITSDITTDGQSLTLTSNQGNLQTGNLSSANPTGSGGNLNLFSPTGSITTGNLNTSGNTSGGDITLQAQIAITTGEINSSATTGNGGSVFLDPIGNIQVSLINAQGGNNGTGGNVFAESTGGFFQATSTFLNSNGINASISTAGGLGGGTIELRHQGGALNNPIQPFVIGNGAVNGTAGAITTGEFTLNPTQELATSLTLGTIQIITDDPTTTSTATPTPTSSPSGVSITLPLPTAFIPTISPTSAPLSDPTPTPNPSPSSAAAASPPPSSPISTPIPVTPPAVLPVAGVSSEPFMSAIAETNPDTETNSSVNSALLSQVDIPKPIVIPTDTVNLDKTIAALEAQLTREYQAYLRLDTPTRILELKEIQHRLLKASQAMPLNPGLIYIVFGRRHIEENAALICPIPSPSGAETASARQKPPACIPHPQDALELILVTANQEPIHLKLPGVKREDILALVNQLREETTNQFKLRTTTYLAPAQALYRLIIAPLKSTLEEQGIETLAIIPDAGIRSLPIAALHDGERFLMEEYSLGLIPSFSLTLPEYKNLQQAQVLAMGASEFTNLPPLPAVPLELEAISGNRAFLNQQFTLENLIEQHKRYGFPIIHLATHADFQPGVPDNSFIQFWESQLELPQMKAFEWDHPPVDLLVLSACRTAIGSEEAELGFAGLAVLSGAKSALASLWYSSDLGTLALMSKFYEQLESAPIRAEALRQAQLAMLRGEVSLEKGQLQGMRGKAGILLPPELAGESALFAHPYYWASFTMIGTPW